MKQAGAFCAGLFFCSFRPGAVRSDQETSVGADDLACDEPGFVRDEETDERGHVFRPADHAERRLLSQSVHDGPGQARVHLRIDHAGGTQLTLMPEGPSSLANDFVKPMTAALDAE
jgi:hypothetical protein